MSRVKLLILIAGCALLGGAQVSAAQPAASAGRPEPLSVAPVALQTAASAVIGRQDRRFDITKRGSVFVATGSGLSARFGARGPVISAAGQDLGLRLLGLGRGRQLSAVAPGSTRATATQVEYVRGALTEWYRNGPLGIEQGFTVSRRPTGTGGWLTLAVDTTGPLKPTEQGSQVLFAGGSSSLPIIQYGGLSATDASGRALPVHLQLRGQTVLLRVEDTNARYPLTVDPFVQQAAKLTPSDETGAGGFGLSVAMSSDGSTALIGAEHDNGDVGAAWVFTHTGSTWTQQGPKLTGAGEIGDGVFGGSAALSGDGSTALVGGQYDHGDLGAVWVFTRSGSTWTQQAELTPSDESGEGLFGLNVALSTDGNTALIGGEGDNGDAGAAWVFTRSGSIWTQQGTKLVGNCTTACTGPLGTGETGTGEFGNSVSLSSDGNTALIGGLQDNTTEGAAWVFTRSGSTWSQQGAKLAPSDATSPTGFGGSVDLSSDGDTALIGGPYDNGGRGAVWVFTRSGSTWTQQGSKLQPNDRVPGGAYFGASVSLSSDASTALIGGYHDTNDAGAVWLFTQSGSTWTQQGGRITPSDETGPGWFGSSVALSSDASEAIIGGEEDNSNAGAAWAYAQASAPGAPTGVTASPGNGQATVSFTPPASDGGAAVTSYTVTASPGGAQGNGTGSPITVSGLTDGKPYTFTVTATNPAGTGPASQASTAVTPQASVPGAPTGVTATAGNGQATVAFVAPASNGGAPITSYTVTASPGLAHASGATSPITVSGLTNGTPYTFTVTATNSAGPGPASGPSAPATPEAGLPGAPTAVSAAAGNGQATVTFSPPASNGGAPITSYTATASPGGAHASGGASPITVSGLTNGTSYTFTVTATNASGIGPASAPSSAVTPTAPSGGGGGGGGGGGSDAVSVTMSPTSQTVVSGGTATWTVVITNTGGSYLFDVGATDAAASGCVEANASTPAQMLATLETMAPGVSVTYSCSLTGITGSLANNLTASGVGPDAATASATATGTVTVSGSAPLTPPVALVPTVKTAGHTTSTTLPFTVLSLGAIHLDVHRPTLRLEVKVTSTRVFTIVLLDSKRHTLARWTIHVKKGSSTLSLLVPTKARHKGHEVVHVSEAGSSSTKALQVSLIA